MSYNYYVNNPHLKKSFRAIKSSGTAINGSQVSSIGEVKLEFKLGDVPMSMVCKVIKGLMDPLVLGWNWMAKYAVMLDAKNGKVLFCENKSAPLLENNQLFSGLFYRAQEDITLPPSSKVYTNV